MYKIFACKRTGHYSGGLALIAANTAEEAFLKFHQHPNYKYMLDYLDCITHYYTEDITKCDSDYYKRADWFEVPNLQTNDPNFILENGYTE